jgi:hypothetical protein
VVGGPGERVDVVVADEHQLLHSVQCELSSEGKAQLVPPPWWFR